MPDPADDPIVAQRARFAALAVLGKRVGYLALLVACVAFVAGVLRDLPPWSVATVVAGFAVATACLVPAIILGYAVAKAEHARTPARPSAADGHDAAGHNAADAHREGPARSVPFVRLAGHARLGHDGEEAGPRGAKPWVCVLRSSRLDVTPPDRPSRLVRRRR